MDRWSVTLLLACVCLVSAAHPAEGRTPPLRYRAITADGVVRDTATGLVWQQSPPNTMFALPEARSYCAALTAQNKPWRLPSIKELLTLVDPTESDPCIDTVAFPGALGSLYWTSTPEKASTGERTWTVNFASGITSAQIPTATWAVRCVQ